MLAAYVNSIFGSGGMMIAPSQKTLFGLLGVAVLAALPSFAATTTGLELALLVDVSGSVDASEFALQRDGYVNAFQSAAVQNAILGSVNGSIAVTYIYWSSAGSQQQTVGWTLIDSVASANAFATAIAGAARPFGGGSTAPGSAIAFSVPGFGTNDFDAPRQIIDVSGDGAQNDGINTAGARDAALAAGIDAINGLVILGEVGLEAWYNANVKGGAGAFVSVANDFGDFGQAIQAKLIAEISGIPEPSSVVLMLTTLGLVGVVARRRTVRNR